MRLQGRTLVLFDQYRTIGGGQTVLLSVAEAAQQLVDTIVLVIPKGGSLETAARDRLPGNLKIIGASELRMTSGRKAPLDFLRLAYGTATFVIRYIRLARRSTLLYANGPRQFLGVALLASIARRPCIYHLHLDHKMVEKRVIGFIAGLRWTAAVIANSSFTYSRLISALPKLKYNKNVITIENALSAAYCGGAFENRFVGHLETWNILVIGVIRPEKGQDLAVALAKQMQDVRVHIVGAAGAGAERWAAELRRKAPDNVTFHEFVDDVQAFIRHHQIHFCLVPSRTDESFGLSAIEAMACSCIAVVRDGGGLAEVAARTGAVVFSGGVDELAIVVHALMNMGNEKLSELADMQRRRTLENYGLSGFVYAIRRVLIAHLDGTNVSEATRHV